MANKQHKTLKLAESFKLMKLLENEYTDKKMGDVQFAEYATQKLGFEVNADHVYNRRSDMQIPATRTAASSVGRGVLVDRVRVLEERILTLEKLMVGKMTSK